MKRVIATNNAAAMYNPVSQATLAPNGMLFTAVACVGAVQSTSRDATA